MDQFSCEEILSGLKDGWEIWQGKDQGFSTWKWSASVFLKMGQLCNCLWWIFGRKKCFEPEPESNQGFRADRNVYMYKQNEGREGVGDGAALDFKTFRCQGK